MRNARFIIALLGALFGGSKLCECAKIGMVGVPKTIDNNVHGTEWSVGFATALTVLTEALDPEDPLFRTARGLGIHLGEQRSKARR